MSACKGVMLTPAPPARPRQRRRACPASWPHSSPSRRLQFPGGWVLEVTVRTAGGRTARRPLGCGWRQPVGLSQAARQVGSVGAAPGPPRPLLACTPGPALHTQALGNRSSLPDARWSTCLPSHPQMCREGLEGVARRAVWLRKDGQPAAGRGSKGGRGGRSCRVRPGHRALGPSPCVDVLWASAGGKGRLGWARTWESSS